ncbi:MAG: hypothetical protein ABJ246_06675 [Paracoccaceae bacterium]
MNVLNEELIKELEERYSILTKRSQVDHLKHLREISGQLIDCKKELEANWRLQVLFLALGFSVLFGFDAAVLASLLFKPEGVNADIVKIATRVTISLLLLYYFFQFGILLGKYRETKRRANYAKKLNTVSAADDVGLGNLKDGEKNTLEIYVQNLDSPYSQFEFFFREWTDYRTIGVLFYLVVMTAAMHGLGAFLLYDLFQNHLGPPWDICSIVAPLVYAFIIGCLYCGHCARIKEADDDGDSFGLTPAQEKILDRTVERQLTSNVQLCTARFMGIVTCLAAVAFFFYLCWLTTSL